MRALCIKTARISQLMKFFKGVNMKKKTIILVMCGIIAIIFLILTLTYTPDTPHSQPDTTTPSDTSATPETPPQTSPLKPLSPYNPEDDINPFFIPVYSSDVIVENATVSVDAENNPALSIDLGDVCTVRLSNQPASVQAQKIKMYVFAHNTMKDPFLHTIQNFSKPILTSTFSPYEENAFVSNFTIGYESIENGFADIVLTYDDVIIGYYKFIVCNTKSDALEYWQHTDPAQTYMRFYIQCNDTMYTHFYISTNGPGTLYEWVGQNTCRGWYIENGYLATNNRTFMIHESQCAQTIEPDHVYTAIEYQKHTMEFDYGESNKNNAIYYLGLSQEEATKVLGAPKEISTTHLITLLQYDFGCMFVKDGQIVQITLNTDTINIATGLPTVSASRGDIIFASQRCGTHLLRGRYQTDKEIHVYKYYYTIQHGAEKWAITYVWEYNESFDVDAKPCTQVVVHLAPQILY
jgi:hypothetical protein